MVSEGQFRIVTAEGVPTVNAAGSPAHATFADIGIDSVDQAAILLALHARHALVVADEDRSRATSIAGILADAAEHEPGQTV
jgi:hypothetical protein